MKARGWISRYEIKPMNAQGRLKVYSRGRGFSLPPSGRGSLI